MSPGSSRRERTAASAGAFSSPARSGAAAASWACVACSWASAPAMSSLRGPASARRSASRCSSAWARATCAALRARSMSWALTPRPCVLAAMPRSRQVLPGARRASACAATSRLRAWAISSDASRCAGAAASVAASICARAWSACSASVRVSSTASTAHAVAFFGAQFLRGIAVEGQRDLADVHVAVVDEIAAAVALAVAPAAPGGSDRPRRRR